MAWAIPGDPSGSRGLKEELLISGRKIYNRGSRKIKSKTVADVVEALIGVYHNAGGEQAALLFMNWLGIGIDFSAVPYTRKIPAGMTNHVNIHHLQTLLNYTFKDNSLLLEALTHGSFTLAGVPRSYQRPEFLGDAVLDYLVTVHLYTEYPGLSPGELTDLRSASVSNDSYAQAALCAGLYKHIFHASQALHKHLNAAVNEFEQLSADGTHGWDTEISFPKVLADIIEPLAGAIFLDSGYDKEAVLRSLRPLLEPMKLHPVKELQELCAKHDYHRRKPVVSFDDGFVSMTLEVEADGVLYSHTALLLTGRPLKESLRRSS